MNEQTVAIEQLRRELDYYKKQVDELAGENFRLDTSISGLRHELKQKRQGFALLSELQQSIGTYKEASPIFEITIQAINATLGMDKTVVLAPTDEKNCYRPSQWLGFHQGDAERLSALQFRFPPEFAEGTGLLLVTESTKSTSSLIKEIQTAFDLPYFICLPVMVDNIPIGLLLSGRSMVGGPFYRPIDKGDVDTFQAVAGLISASVQNIQVTILEEMDRLKTEFFANISHEFRTPITLTLGPLEGLLGGRYGQMSSVVRDQLQLMQRNQTRLLNLINQILDLVKLEAGGMELKAAPMPDMNRFVQDRIDLFRSAADKRGIEFKISLDKRVSGADLFIDREKLDKVLLNLLSNALKFTRQGYIEVRTQIHEDRFCLEVTDTGIGIKPDQLPHIFDRFRQADVSVSREYSGTGIGLTLAREIVRLHGGDITVHSQYGKGSSFRFFIPLGSVHLDPASVVEFAEELTTSADLGKVIVIGEGATDQQNADRINQETEAAFNPAKSTILYVEDNPNLRNYIRDLLMEHYNVFLAVDGRDGLDKTRYYMPDLVITDQMMPHISGRDLLREIRDDPELRPIPVVFLTARVGTEARVESLDAGADDYLAKPFDEEELMARVRNLLLARAQERELAEHNRRLEHELEDARQIQLSLLPKESPQMAGYEIAGTSLPAKEVSGDFYTYLSLGKNTGIVLADVTGKSVKAAMVAAMTNGMLNEAIGPRKELWNSPSMILRRLNMGLRPHLIRGMYTAMSLSILRAKEKQLVFSNAGMPYPIVKRGKEVWELEVNGMPLGLIEKAEYQDLVFDMEGADLVVFYSDGVIEAENGAEEMYQTERVLTLIQQADPGVSAQEMVDLMVRDVTAFAYGEEASDDITIVVLRCKQ